MGTPASTHQVTKLLKDSRTTVVIQYGCRLSVHV